ncbi:MAG: ROK family protein [Planctomycetaceae bacterium]
MASSRLFVGIEIGGTKLQLGLGTGVTAELLALERDTVRLPGQATEIQQQIVAGCDRLLRRAGVEPGQVAGCGVGFGGPVETATGTITKSHQVAGWEQFRFTSWLRAQTGWPIVLHNDADSAAFAEAQFGAGRGYDPVLYVTIGSGIGGGLVVGGQVYRGQGAGAVEIGHLRPGGTPRRVPLAATTVESIASGFGLTERARQLVADPTLSARVGAADAGGLRSLCGGEPSRLDTRLVAEGARAGDRLCGDLLADATDTLAWGLSQAIALLNPARIVLGGGVSLLGVEAFFDPVRRAVQAQVFVPFRGLAEIVPAQLGEEMVVYGALALARQALAEEAGHHV